MVKLLSLLLPNSLVLAYFTFRKVSISALQYLRKILERATGIEPVTSSLGSWHSTAELRPLRYRRRRKFIWNYDTLVNQKRCPTPTSAPSDKIRAKVTH